MEHDGNVRSRIGDGLVQRVVESDRFGPLHLKVDMWNRRANVGRFFTAGELAAAARICAKQSANFRGSLAFATLPFIARL
jgi:hypothetical protein